MNLIEIGGISVTLSKNEKIELDNWKQSRIIQKLVDGILKKPTIVNLRLLSDLNYMGLYRISIFFQIIYVF